LEEEGGVGLPGTAEKARDLAVGERDRRDVEERFAGRYPVVEGRPGGGGVVPVFCQEGGVVIGALSHVQRLVEGIAGVVEGICRPGRQRGGGHSSPDACRRSATVDVGPRGVPRKAAEGVGDRHGATRVLKHHHRLPRAVGRQVVHGDKLGRVRLTVAQSGADHQYERRQHREVEKKLETKFIYAQV